MAQTNQSTALDRLERSGLVTSREKGLLLQRDSVLKTLARRSSPNAAPPDYSRKYAQLGLVVRAKEFSTSGTSSLFTFIPAPAASRNLEPAVIHAELDSFIQRLVRADLVSDETRVELTRMNNKGRLGWELEAANVAYQAANQEYYLRPQKLKKFADSLRSTKVISEENYKRLMEKSRQGKLHRYAELLSYLGFCSIIVPANLPRDSMGLLHALYRGASQVLSRAPV